MKTPRIRFNGYTSDWEQRKLGELYERNSERNIDLLDYDKTISVATMSYKNEGNGASDDSLATYKVLRIGDIAFEGHTNKQFRFGRFVVNDIGTGIMSPRFSTLRPIKDMPVEFWKQYIHYEPIMRKILVNSTKAGTMMNELVIPEFLEQMIMVPSVEEQKKIGECFKAIDTLITLHQRKCDEAKKLKKYMLQKMFPQNGAKIPEIRFDGFDNDWEQRKLETLADVKTGYPFDSEDFDESGEYLVVTNGNIQNESERVNPIIGNRIDITDSKILTTYLLNMNDILVTMDGTVGRTAKVADEKLILAQRVGRLIPFINAEFLYQWLNTGKFFKDMKDLSHGGTIKHISLKEIGSYTAYLPKSEAEQSMIGDYFKNLDHLITLHQRKVDLLKKLKKSMLDNMFV